jgi:hypothetical protein
MHLIFYNICSSTHYCSLIRVIINRGYKNGDRQSILLDRMSFIEFDAEGVFVWQCTISTKKAACLGCLV